MSKVTDAALVIGDKLGIDISQVESDLRGMENFLRYCHTLAEKSGWWSDLEGNPVERNKGEMLCLIHSEISEAMEGARKNLKDDHLPEFDMEVVELADVLIRLGDYAFGFGHQNLGEATIQKLAYNQKRADHKPENRFKDGGKKF